MADRAERPGFQPGASLSQADEIKFVFLTLAEAAERVAAGPEFSLGHVFEGSDTDGNAEDKTRDSAGREILIARVGCELDTEVAFGRGGIHGIPMTFDPDAFFPQAMGQIGKLCGDHDEVRVAVMPPA